MRVNGEISGKFIKQNPRYRRKGILLDICFYYQNEHNTLNNVHSFIYYSMMSAVCIGRHLSESQ